MAIWSSGAGNNGIWAPDPLYGGIWASDMQRAVSRAFITDNGGTTLLNASTGYINPNVTFSRASNGMVCDQDGNWTWTALPYRRSYDVQTKGWGYLFEPQRTNLCNGTVGGPGPNMTVVAMPDRGAMKSCRFSNTAGSGGSAYCFIGAEFTVASGSTVVASRFQSRAPSGANRHVIQRADGSALDGTRTTTATDLGNGTWRVQTVYTAATAYTNLALTASEFDNDIINPMECWGWQLETGAVATSPIATNGAQVTVAADVCTYANSVLTVSVGTVLARVLTNRGDLAGQNAYVLDNWMFLRDSNRDVYLWDGGGPRSTAVSAPLTAVTSTNKAGSSVTVLAQGGTEAIQASGAQDMPAGNIIIGNSLGGYINHLSVFPTQLTAPKRATAAGFTKF